MNLTERSEQPELTASPVHALVVRLSDAVTIIRADCRDVLPLPCDAVVTDPPYGVNHKPGSEKHSKIRGGIAGDEEPPDLRWVAEFPAVVWGGNNFCDQLPRSTGWLVWDKTFPECAQHSQAELAWTNMMTRTIRVHREAYHGFMRKRDGWFHQHQKPPALMAWCLQWTKEGDTVLDPYMGSGTTGIACIRGRRKFIGIELDPDTFETARKRLEAELRQGILL